MAEYIIPDEPWEVTVQKQRQEFIVSKVLDKVPDEDEESDEVIAGALPPR